VHPSNKAKNLGNDMSLQSLEKLEEKLEYLQVELEQAYEFELPETQSELRH